MNITNAMLDEYSNERIEDDDRPVLIDPGIYKGHLMNFKIRDEVIPGWFNIAPSESKTTVKAGWKSNFLRMYQGCLDIRLDRRDRISLAPLNNKPMMLEVVSIERDAEHKEMAQVNHYSRVKKILKVIDEE